MTLILTIIFAGLGLIIGSFLNVVILRLNTQKTLGGRSACMSCRSTLSWYELIPVFSYLGLGGKCKSCQSRISMQYPLVELLTGIVFALLFIKFGDLFFYDSLSFIISYAYYALMCALLIVIAVYDLRHKIIPDILSFVIGGLGFLGIFLFDHGTLSVHAPSLANFLAGFAVSVPFALLWFLSRGRWMGLGDGKLLVGLGFLLGMLGVLSAVIFAFWAGGIIGIILLAFSKKYGRKSEVPFAPFLILGTFLVLLCDLYLPLF